MSLSSNGSGGFLNSLQKEGLLSTIKESGLSYISIVNPSNLLSNFADPTIIGMMKNSKNGVFLDSIRR